MHTISDFIEIAKKGSSQDGVSLIDKQIIESKQMTMPDGYASVERWTFSDGTVIRFHDKTDTEPGWKGHDRYWVFESRGTSVSSEAENELASKHGNV